MSRTQETLHRLLHLLQFLALRIGLHLNGDKCQLITIHSTLPISLSNSVTIDQPCSCPFCSTAYDLEPNYDSLATPLSPLTSAKYLGSYLTPPASSIPDVLHRCSQASTAFKQLDPFFRHPLISPRKKLQVYSQIIQAILLHGSDSQVYSLAQIVKIDSLHFKALRQIFQVKSSYYHRV